MFYLLIIDGAPKWIVDESTGAKVISLYQTREAAISAALEQPHIHDVEVRKYNIDDAGVVVYRLVGK